MSLCFCHSAVPRGLAPIVLLLVVLLLVGGQSSPAKAQENIDIEKPPINYSETKAVNRVTKLIDDVAAGRVRLDYSREQGYLKSILEALDIRESSQVLVFSKTSLQVRYISRRNPRAIYFNDDTYVGWVRGSSLMEISTFDPKLGAAFYTVDMMPWRAKIKQATYDCLACHATSMSAGVPGHMVRSVHPFVDGSVNNQAESFITGHHSPIAERWGGWYVTGRHGEMRHMGNTFLRSGVLDTRGNGNRLNLWDEFDADDYLSPYSDIVALMVLEHQTQTHNALVRADFNVRKRMLDRSRDAGEPTRDDEWRAELTLIAKEVVRQLLFFDEADLVAPVVGSAVFAEEFVKRGPQDDQGRSLREFDLTTRLFKYPCSYLIHSDAFDSLQTPLKREIYRQLLEVLESDPPPDHGAALDAETRQSILGILRATQPDFERAYVDRTERQESPAATTIPRE